MSIACRRGLHELGDGLLPTDAAMYATVAASAEMQAAPPPLVHTLKTADGPAEELIAYVRRIFGPFRFEGIELRRPTDTFEGELELRIGDRGVRFLEVGRPTPTATRSSTSPTPASS